MNENDILHDQAVKMTPKSTTTILVIDPESYERVEADNARLREVNAELLAALKDWVSRSIYVGRDWDKEYCNGCYVWLWNGDQHKEDCPIVRAETIIAKAEAD
jgi:hypothetical protein